ncbi:MAG: VWA domain-containing protein [Candidatus Binatia bacterium]
MRSSLDRLGRCWLFLALAVTFAGVGWTAEPKLQILSPQNGARISQDQNLLLLSGKVTSHTARSVNVDIVFLIDVSLSTAHYAGVDFPDLVDLPGLYLSPGSSGSRPQISVFGAGIDVGTGEAPSFNLRNSIFAAEVIASRRMLSQLDTRTTRVGVITFSDDARVQQPLTHDFERVRQILDEVYRSGPYGGTNMVEGIRLGIKELLGLGASEKRMNAIKTQLLLTDGLPSLPIGQGKRSTPEDTNLAINAARMSGKAGMRVHVFGLGKEVVDYPYAANGIARESGGAYIPLLRPADLLLAMESISAVDVHSVQVLNQTTGQKATRTRLGADGLFGAAVPVTEGPNHIEVFARASDGSTNRASVTVYYETGSQKSVDLEIFMEKEKKLQVEIERLGKTREEVQLEIERRRQNVNVGRQSAPLQADGAPR